MAGDAFPTPTRFERRGDFPDHPAPPRHFHILTGAEALQIARANLAAWIDEHRRGDRWDDE